ncbi:hypothetical protein N5853_01520 [Bartonella sp. HY329]|uniref:hypothetical protein n=1 Tax=unclassified Bartonella TaxID=2645622 RepID=UPI0021CAD4F8|nr:MULTISPECIES: hypothetical protein [unclassified Bartonella]UXM95351.1 hypothetical protein N5853_01520 [Bartonella sp. HY329]UXN09676.1 hypothetical protein N5852_01525 [Bartonella sp. HY328]
MESARNKKTQEIEYAKDLLNQAQVDTENYECWGCYLDMIPASWRAENTKVQAYFRSKKGERHAENCGAVESTELIRKAQKCSIRSELDASPVLSPTGLKLNSKHLKVDNEIGKESSTQGASTRNSHNSTLTEAGNSHKRQPAQSLYPIAHAFINFPNDRNMKLAIDGVFGNNYNTCFKNLPHEIYLNSKNKIFYAPLFWTNYNESLKDNSCLDIITINGKWENKKPKTTYTLHVDWKNWSQRAKTILINQLNSTITDAKNNSEFKKKAWLFFIADQDKTNPKYYHVNDHRLLCAISALNFT